MSHWGYVIEELMHGDERERRARRFRQQRKLSQQAHWSQRMGGVLGWLRRSTSVSATQACAPERRPWRDGADEPVIGGRVTHKVQVSGSD